jgi:hypothetical protein
MVQWQIVHGICVLEIAIFLILCIPLPATWYGQHLSESDVCLAALFSTVFLAISDASC